MRRSKSIIEAHDSSSVRASCLLSSSWHLEIAVSTGRDNIAQGTQRIREVQLARVLGTTPASVTVSTRPATATAATTALAKSAAAVEAAALAAAFAKAALAAALAATLAKAAAFATT